MRDKAGEVQLAGGADEARLVFPPDFRIGATKGFIALLQRSLEKKPASLVLDAAKLERVDAAALQAIVVAWRRAKAAGIQVRWENVPANLLGGAMLTGLASAGGLAP
jgi:anti-anti-sigma regulatory factor